MFFCRPLYTMLPAGCCSIACWCWSGGSAVTCCFLSAMLCIISSTVARASCWMASDIVAYISMYYTDFIACIFFNFPMQIIKIGNIHWNLPFPAFTNNNKCIFEQMPLRHDAAAVCKQSTRTKTTDAPTAVTYKYLQHSIV